MAEAGSVYKMIFWKAPLNTTPPPPLYHCVIPIPNIIISKMPPKMKTKTDEKLVQNFIWPLYGLMAQ
jgi:hypothetical protein